jgi:hypothetical protein
MANVEVHHEPQAVTPARAETKTREAAGGSFLEAIAGVGAVVLAILGLAGVFPVTLASIATIALGAALMLEGGSIASRLYASMSREQADVPSDLIGGLGAESVAGIAALALGVLALIGVDTFVLLQIAMIVIGAGLLFGSSATWRVNYPRLGGYEKSDTAGYLAREAVHSAAGAHALVGVAVVVLGILALMGTAPLTLTLVSILCVGAVVVLSGAAIGGRFLSGMRRRHA